MEVISSKSGIRYYLGIHIIIWVLFIMISLIPEYQSNQPIDINFMASWICNIIIFYLNFFYLVPKLLLKKKYFLYVIFLLISISFFGIIRYNFFLPNFIEPPSPPLAYKFFDQNGHEVFLKKISLNKAPFMINIVIVFSSIFFSFMSVIIKTLSEYYNNQQNKLLIETQRRATELIYLRNQTNPHFLFNSLNSIYSLANRKSDLVPNAIVNLSELMRYMLYETDSKFVLLEKEVQYIENYIELQKLRLNNIENIYFNVHGEMKNKFIEPLLLISFIENAFKYGTDYKGTTYVKIKIIIKENILDFMVENRIENREVDTQNSGIGIKNIESRLRLLYPNSHKLEFFETSNLYKVHLNLKLDEVFTLIK